MRCLIGYDHSLLAVPLLSFCAQEDPSQAVASLVVLSFPTLEVVFEAYSRVHLQLPYISGTCLAF